MEFLSCEDGKLAYTESKEEIQALAILFDKDDGKILKFGEKADVEQYHKNNPPDVQEMDAIASLDNLSKEDAGVVVEFFMSRNCGNSFLSFLAADTTEQQSRIKEMKNSLGVHNEADYKYNLYCGHCSYGITPEVNKALEGLMYWTYEERMERASKNPDKKYLDNADLSIRQMMNRCEELGVPNWVGNGAIEFARDNDLKAHYMSEFFTKSAYAEKKEKKQTDIER